MMQKEYIQIQLPVSNKQVVEVPITLAFKYSHKKAPWYGKIISWWTQSPYYHVEIILFEKYWISANPDDDVYIRNLAPLKDSWDYVTLQPLKVSREQLERVVKYINHQNGKPYDFLGILLSQVFNWSIANDRKWFCSEIAVKILNLLGCDLYFTQAPQNYSPGDMYRALKEDAEHFEYYQDKAPDKASRGYVISTELNSKKKK